MPLRRLLSCIYKLLRLDARLPRTEQLHIRTQPLCRELVKRTLELKQYSQAEESGVILGKVDALRMLPLLIAGVCKMSPVLAIDGETDADAGPASIATVGEATAQTDTEAREMLAAAVDELVAAHFPMVSHELQPGDPRETIHVQLMQELLRVLSSGGVMLLVDTLCRCAFKEGRRHRQWFRIRRALGSLANQVDYAEPAAMQAVVRVCTRILGNDREDVSVRGVVLELLLVPVLRRAPASAIVDLFTTPGAVVWGRQKKAKKKSAPADAAATHPCLLDTLLLDLQRVVPADPGDDRSDMWMRQWAALTLIECLYDALPKGGAKLGRNTLEDCIEKKFMDKTGKIAINRLLGNIALNTMVRAQVPPDLTPAAAEGLDSDARAQRDVLVELRRNWCQAGYKFLAVLTLASRVAPDPMTKFLFDDAKNRKFSNLVDPDCKHDFHIETPHTTETISLGHHALRINQGHPLSAVAQCDRVGAHWGALGNLLHAAPSYFVESQVLSGSSLSQGLPDAAGASVTGGDSDSARVMEASQSQAANASQSMEIEKYGLPDKETDETKEAGEGDLPAAGDEMPVPEDGTATLELVDLNREPCMPYMVRAIVRLDEMDQLLNDADERKWGPATMPTWLECVVRDLMGDARGRNARLLGLRLLLHEKVAVIAKPWAQILLAPVLRVVVAELCDVASGFHVIHRDLCTLLGPPSTNNRDEFSGAWSEATPSTSDETALAVRFLNHLIAVCWYPNMPVIRSNLQHIRDLLTRWQIRGLDLEPVAVLLETEFEGSGGAKGAAVSKLSKGAVAWSKRRAGPNLMGILLDPHVAYPVFEADSEEAPRLIDALPTSLAYNRKEVFTTAATVIGLALNAIDASKGTLCEAARNQGLAKAARARLDKLAKFDAKAKPQLVYCICRLTEQYPPFLNRSLLTSKLLPIFGSLKSAGRAEVMQAFCVMEESELPKDPSLLDWIKAQLPALLTDATEFNLGSLSQPRWEPTVQLATVAFLRRQALELTDPQLKLIFGPRGGGAGASKPLGAVLCDSPSRDLRRAAYDLIAVLYTKHPFFAETANTTASSEDGENDETAARRNSLRNAMRCLLLKGLADRDDEGMADDGHGGLADDRMEDDEQGESNQENQGEGATPPRGVRRTLFDFWNNSAQLSSTPLGRLTALLTELWDPSIAEQWVHYAAWLLLQLSTSCPGYGRDELWKKPLDDIVFTQLDLSNNSHSMPRPMAPQFSFERTSQISQSQDASGILEPLGTQTVDNSQHRAGDGFLRATQDNHWTQTQQVFGIAATQEYFGSSRASGDAVSAAPAAALLGSQQHGGANNAAPPSQSAGSGRLLFSIGSSTAASSTMPPPTSRARNGRGGGGGRQRFATTANTDSLAQGIQRRRGMAAHRTKQARKKKVLLYRR